jgi:hypothetical protein
MRTFLIALLVIAAVAIGGGFIASTAYQAGLSADVTVVQADGTTGTAVTPVIVPTYGWGWNGYGPGVGPGPFLGFLGTLFMIVLLIGLIRLVFFAGRGRRGNGPGNSGPGGWGPGRWGPPGRWGDPSRWEGHAHEVFDDWHSSAHDPAATKTTEATD